ncbi:hypothetical protein [Endozoicomonas sp. SESOKO1]|uniref:hypothetical protein n=1 Tax=Endozoicomonas sp. SESOKO1 TaxID=2828742 RepID=UPI002147A651|nr:hypothetical protein [Endozoicomonas sp. SESOKO1]
MKTQPEGNTFHQWHTQKPLCPLSTAGNFSHQNFSQQGISREIAPDKNEIKPHRQKNGILYAYHLAIHVGTRFNGINPAADIIGLHYYACQNYPGLIQ